MPALLTALFVALGLAIGSFLNVCIDRLPGGKSIISPPSHCDQCGHRLTFADLIPVFSFLLLRGRCRYCRARLPGRIVIVELVSGALLGILYTVFGLHPAFAVTAFWGCLFIVIFVIDLEHGLILNVMVYPALAIAVLIAGVTRDLPWLAGISFMEDWPQLAVSALGGAVGFGCFLLLAVGASALLGKEGMGWGDVKLAALIGLVCGFPLVLIVMMLGATIGLVMAMLMGRLKSGETIPFGSALAIASMLAVLGGQKLLDWIANAYA